MLCPASDPTFKLCSAFATLIVTEIEHLRFVRESLHLIVSSSFLLRSLFAAGDEFQVTNVSDVSQYFVTYTSIAADHACQPGTSIVAQSLYTD